jgi:hypothetical protein
MPLAYFGYPLLPGLAAPFLVLVFLYVFIRYAMIEPFRNAWSRKPKYRLEPEKSPVKPNIQGGKTPIRRRKGRP